MSREERRSVERGAEGRGREGRGGEEREVKSNLPITVLFRSSLLNLLGPELVSLLRTFIFAHSFFISFVSFSLSSALSPLLSLYILMFYSMFGESIKGRPWTTASGKTIESSMTGCVQHSSPVFPLLFAFGDS